MQRHTSPPQTKVQGDSPSPPPPMPPTRMLITSTCFQSVTSYLVHINFSLCRISPQSFQFVGQVVQLLYSIRNMFQMTPLALQAHLQVAYKIVNNTNTFLYRDLPDPGCNCCLQQFKSPIVWQLFLYTRSFR